MMHTKRTWCVNLVGSPEELAEKLTNHSWTLCTGMKHGDYLFLNDSTSEDGAQEYAVVKLPGDTGGFPRQVESITFGWCDFEKGLEYVRRTLAGEYDDGGTSLPGLRLETPDQHDRCHLCM
jgi:hypothetical protein